MLYFVLVEIINSSYNEIIIDILYGLIVSITVFYSIYYIMKIKLNPKKIISIILNNLIATFIINIFFLYSFFLLCLGTNKLEYFFVNKIFMKSAGFLLFLLFELYYLFRIYEEKNFKFFYIYNVYSNKYLYSNTNILYTFLRVFISIIIEHYLLSKLDILYKKDDSINKCLIIITLDIIHGFLVYLLIKYIFNLIYLNNLELSNVECDKPFMRYGSFAEGKKNDPLFFFENDEN